MLEHKSKTYPYKTHALICGAQPMEDGSFSASLMVAKREQPEDAEQVVLLSPAPFNDPDMAIAHALLNGRHWVDNLVVAP